MANSKNMSTCQSHATNMPRFMPMFVQVKTPTNLKRQIEGTLEESIFSSKRTVSRPMALLEQSSTGLGRGETKEKTGDQAIGGEALPP